MDNEREWAQWFENYRAFILHYAKLTETSGIEAPCIGTELRRASPDHSECWRALIQDVVQEGAVGQAPIQTEVRA